MFKKIINNNKGVEWNILMFSIMYCLLFIIILTPVIIIVASKNQELMAILTTNKESSIEIINEIILMIKSFLEFFIMGTITEFIRRKISTGFKLESLTATKILFYFCVEMFLYIIIKILEVLI